MNSRHRGTLRTDFETDLARLDEFHVMESEGQRLMYKLICDCDGNTYRSADEGGRTLCPMLEDHVLTVFTDIARKKLSDYGNNFANVQGTAMQAAYVQKLRQDINRWIVRLDNYLYSIWRTGNNNNLAAETARWLKDRLEQSLSADELDGNNNYYRMLRTVIAIQENVDYYLDQIKDSGDMNPALSLLIVYLKNYGSIAEAFNRRLATLPELYRKDILHAVPQDAVQDNVYVIITPTEGIGGFTLPKDEPFPAGQNATGEELIYRTEKKEYISPIQCVEADALYGFPILLMEELWNSINNLYNFKIQPMLKPCSHMVKNYA